MRGEKMKSLRIVVCFSAALLIAGVASAQNPNGKHFDKDGLSFDYPTDWQLSDQSTGQMQFVELTKGDLVIRVRSPREWLKTPEKEAQARKLIQDQYVDSFASQLEQAGMRPTRSTVSTQIAGVDAEGARVRAVLDGQPGGMDSYYRIISDRFLGLSIIGSEKEFAKSAAAWNMIRASVKVEPPPQPKSTAKPSPTPKP
jgi:hypothetical protein